VVDRLLDVAAIDLDYGTDLRFSLEYVRGDGARRRETADGVRWRAVRGGGPGAVVPLGEGCRALPWLVVVVDHVGARGVRVLAGTIRVTDRTAGVIPTELWRWPVVECGALGLTSALVAV
jgi:hypothetical protein